MKTNLDYRIKADIVGMLAGTLCLIHCVAVPFIFIVKVCSTTCCADTPLWWQLLDYLFLIISFVAIYYSTKKSQSKWITYSLYSTWVLFLITIIGNSQLRFYLPQSVLYLPGVVLILLHFYNHKYCKCEKKNS